MDEIPQVDLPFYELVVLWIMWLIFGLLVGCRRIREERELVVSDIICLILLCGVIGWPFRWFIFYFHHVLLDKNERPNS